jgi:hypothetical protein
MSPFACLPNIMEFIESYSLRDLWVSENKASFVPLQNIKKPKKAGALYNGGERSYEKIVESDTGLTAYQISCRTEKAKEDVLNCGTTKCSKYIPGYQGFLPCNTHNPKVKAYNNN